LTSPLNKLFYQIKPLIPRPVQIAFRRHLVSKRLISYSRVWPINPEAGTAPEGWAGWPEGKGFALVLSHDVDTQQGHDRCYDLMELEGSLGFRSCFNFVAERYRVSGKLRNDLMGRGFDVGNHGLKHDGRLFSSLEIFQERSGRINRYLEEWGCCGFTSPSMHHNLDWMPLLRIDYATSTFDTDPFEPQADGAGTIFPFWVGRKRHEGKGYVELPYTLPQDFTLFVLMKERDIGIWKKKLAWIADRGGMALLNTHPDYMAFDPKESKRYDYPADCYSRFLEHVKEEYAGRYWHVLPGDVADFWRKMPAGERQSLTLGERPG
jgi:hypothetical protein